jgi:hypothetical protein
MTDELKTRLQAADLRLKRVERWVQIATFLSTIAAATSTVIGINTAFPQLRLLEAQGLEATEKQRVSFNFRLKPVLLPSKNSFYVRAKLRNFSVRELRILMIGIRVWKRGKWSDSVTVQGHTDDLIVSDNLVSDCQDLCTSQTATGQLRMRQLDNITLEPTEQDYEHTFGPYPLTEDQLKGGFWILGRAYTVETSAGQCGINHRRQPDPGALPYICETNKKGQLLCPKDYCSDAYAPAEYY